MIYFSHEAQNDGNLEIYNKLASQYKNMMFYNTYEEDLIEKLNTKKSSLIYLNYGNYTSHFENEFTYENVNTFIENIDKKITFNKFDDETIEAVFMKRKPTLFFIRNKYINKTLMFEKKRLPQIVNKVVRIII